MKSLTEKESRELTSLNTAPGKILEILLKISWEAALYIYY